jgi:hypothetical protein
VNGERRICFPSPYRSSKSSVVFILFHGSQALECAQPSESLCRFPHLGAHPAARRFLSAGASPSVTESQYRRCYSWGYTALRYRLATDSVLCVLNIGVVGGKGARNAGILSAVSRYDCLGAHSEWQGRPDRRGGFIRTGNARSRLQGLGASALSSVLASPRLDEGSASSGPVTQPHLLPLEVMEQWWLQRHSSPSFRVQRPPLRKANGTSGQR